MTGPTISAALRTRVRRQARQRCEYCQTPEWITGLVCEIDHIIPRAHGGSTTFDNLCLACSACNAYKQAKMHATDPETGQEVPLFHPRRQRWHEHFAWSESGTLIIGLTSCGRATIEALRLNNVEIVAARALWVGVGWHPPQE